VVAAQRELEHCAGGQDLRGQVRLSVVIFAPAHHVRARAEDADVEGANVEVGQLVQVWDGLQVVVRGGSAEDFGAASNKPPAPQVQLEHVRVDGTRVVDAHFDLLVPLLEARGE